MHRFSDFADEEQLVGQKIKLDELLGKEIAVLNFRISTSKYSEKANKKQCLTLQFEMDEKKYVLFTSSGVLINQIQKYQAEIPFVTVIQKINNFYSFT